MNFSMSNHISFFSSSLILAGLLTLITTLNAADFPVGMDWQRQQDFTKGEQEGESSKATEEAPWYYTWGTAAPDQWDVNTSTPLIWQLTWFGHSRGVWAQQTDRLPIVEQKTLNISLNPPKSTAACYLRWKSPSNKTAKLKIEATLKLSWHGGDGSNAGNAPLQIVVFVLGKDGTQGAELFSQSVADSGSPQTEVTIDLSDIQVALGDDIVFGFKPEELPGGNRYVTVADDISIQLVEIVP